MKKHRQQLSTFLKIAVTLLGLAYVFATVPLDQIGTELTTVHWRWLMVSFLLMTIGFVIRAYRWQLLLRGLGVAVRFRRLLELYFVGNFFNSFLPSGFGGDVVRAWEVAREVPGNVAAGTVIVDRLTGLLMLFVLALLALPFRPEGFPTDLLWLVTAVSLIGLLGGIVLLEGRLITKLGSWLPGKLSVTDPQQPLARILQAVRGCGWTAVLQACAVSVIFNLILIAWWMTTGLALDYEVALSYYFLVVPILSVALLVPSIGGLGVRESLATGLFFGAGLSGAQAFTLSFVLFLLMRVTGILGAPIYIMTLIRQRANATNPTPS